MPLKPMTLEEAIKQVSNNYYGSMFECGDFEKLIKDVKEIARSYALHIIETARPKDVFTGRGHHEEVDDDEIELGAKLMYGNSRIKDYYSSAKALIESD